MEKVNTQWLLDFRRIEKWHELCEKNIIQVSHGRSFNSKLKFLFGMARINCE